MLRFVLRHAKVISMTGGFLFATVGAAWSFLVVDSLSEQGKQLADTKAGLTRQMQSLASIASEYFIANQQGDLIFILAQQDGAREELARLVSKGNLLDRATPIRNMIGALALAKQLDYRPAYDQYERLNDATRSDLSLANFTKLKGEEKKIIVQGQERIPLLLNQLFEIETAINANEAEQKRQRLIGLIASIFGSSLLLLANLFAEREPKQT